MYYHAKYCYRVMLIVECVQISNACHLRSFPLLRLEVYASLDIVCIKASILIRLCVSSAFPPHTIISMPALSPTMAAGNIGAWQKKAGDNLAPGDVLVEIETDKAQMDFEFQDEGVLAKVLKETGEKDVAVGSVSISRVLRGFDRI